MCVNPVPVRVEVDGRPVLLNLPCKHCWHCRKVRVDDYVGRCLAEASVSDWTACLTLTYRDSEARERDGAHRILYPVHFQKFIRALRDRKTTVRYFAVGEYGGRTGRAHFHSMLFGVGLMPPWQAGLVFDKAWPHGGIKADLRPTERAIRYTVKYLLKAEKEKRWFSLSKKPALGSAFFMELARRDAALGSIARNFSYMPPGGSSGRSYLMTGATRRDYLLELCRCRGVIPSEIWSGSSEWLQRSLMKAETWLALKSADPPSLEEFLADFSRRLDEKRPPEPSRPRHYLDDLDDRAHHWENLGGDDG